MVNQVKNRKYSPLRKETDFGFEKLLDEFIQLLEAKTKEENLKVKFDEVVGAMTKITFKQVRDVDEEIKKSKDNAEKLNLENERNELLTNLRDTTAQLAIQADNYLSEQ
ncbi:hypothetical protein KKF61_06820 [Patescibacteria group bacterium]|nr:hypothetical protein [Patescibacteria group bacterium]MBU0963619.1 hypothetical protein [Patescibacteria group bacterium]